MFLTACDGQTHASNRKGLKEITIIRTHCYSYLTLNNKIKCSIVANCSHLRVIYDSGRQRQA